MQTLELLGDLRKHTFDKKKKDLKVPKMHRICMSFVLTRTGVGYVRKENVPI